MNEELKNSLVTLEGFERFKENCDRTYMNKNDLREQEFTIWCDNNENELIWVDGGLKYSVLMVLPDNSIFAFTHRKVITVENYAILYANRGVVDPGTGSGTSTGSIYDFVAMGTVIDGDDKFIITKLILGKGAVGAPGVTTDYIKVIGTKVTNQYGQNE